MYFENFNYDILTFFFNNIHLNIILKPWLLYFYSWNAYRKRYMYTSLSHKTNLIWTSCIATLLSFTSFIIFIYIENKAFCFWKWSAFIEYLFFGLITDLIFGLFVKT